MKSAQENPAVVNQYIQHELACNRLLAPSIHPWPKRHQPGKWHFITDLSHPPSLSINNEIEPRLCSVHYSSVDKAVGLIREKAHAVFLVKVGRGRPCSPSGSCDSMYTPHRHLLGISWNQATYMDTALPFSL